MNSEIFEEIKKNATTTTKEICGSLRNYAASKGGDAEEEFFQEMVSIWLRSVTKEINKILGPNKTLKSTNIFLKNNGITKTT